MSTWLSSLELSRHAALLRRLVECAQAQPVIRFVELGCSVARGAGDELSDLDLALGVVDDDWEEGLDSIPTMLSSLGDVVDMLNHRLTEWGDLRHRRYFVQYRDGVQVDLVALPASSRPGLPAQNVALYDPDERLVKELTVPSEEASADQVREWAFLGWIALADLDKYLRRRSPWEALQRLSLARDFVWRLWAAANDVRFPSFGLTSVLDHEPRRTPQGIELTVAGLDLGELRAASAHLATILARVSDEAGTRFDASLPTAMAQFVTEQLDGVRSLPASPTADVT